MLFQIFDLHHTRIRQQQEDAVKAQKAEAARQKRERKRIIDFDHHFRMIDHHLLNDPVNKSPASISYNVHTKKIKPRIAKIVEKATSAETNFTSRFNALETLSKVAEAVIVNSVASGVGINVMHYYRDDCIEEALL
jgi:hypothetical protein